jgi:hypothetical protein
LPWCDCPLPRRRRRSAMAHACLALRDFRNRNADRRPVRRRLQSDETPNGRRTWVPEYGSGSVGDRRFESISLQRRVLCEPHLGRGSPAAWPQAVYFAMREYVADHPPSRSRRGRRSGPHVFALLRHATQYIGQRGTARSVKEVDRLRAKTGRRRRTMAKSISKASRHAS